MINRIAAREDDGGVVEDFDLLPPELFYRNGLNLDEWTEIYFDGILLGNLVIG